MTSSCRHSILGVNELLMVITLYYSFASLMKSVSRRMQTLLHYTFYWLYNTISAVLRSPLRRIMPNYQSVRLYVYASVCNVNMLLYYQAVKNQFKHNFRNKMNLITIMELFQHKVCAISRYFKVTKCQVRVTNLRLLLRS